jgi:cyclophilin family peptidyl-prolyl cis-trans isomerase
MSLRKFKKYITIFFLSITILIGGCATQPESNVTSSITASTSSTLPVSTSVTSTVSSSSVTSSISSTVTTSTKIMSWANPPAMLIDKTKSYIASMETSLGSFKIKLLAQDSPLTVNNFVFLSREGYYNNVIFHRIMKTFMIQTGDQTGTGSGTPGYKFEDELPPKHSYDPGIVAMANSGPNTNGSQFFICTGSEAANLNNYPNYTEFGRVIEGMDIVQKIASVPVVSNGREVSKPVSPPFIKSITIAEE